jgi:hypothetical protein
MLISGRSGELSLSECLWKFEIEEGIEIMTSEFEDNIKFE